MIGSELSLTPNIGLLEKYYIKFFGVPINGLRIRLRRILPYLNKDNLKILDAGCGRGVFSFEMAKRLPLSSIIAVDMDTSQLTINETIAQKAELNNLSFKQRDVANLKYEEEFDLILSVDNLEHIEDDDKAISSLWKALKDKGTLILHVPADQRRWFLFSFKENFDVPGHFRPGYSLEEIKNKVASASFTIVKAEYTYGFMENLSNNISYQITRAEAKNKALYAIIFPLINLLAWLGRNSLPKKGAGVLIIAIKDSPPTV